MKNEDANREILNQDGQIRLSYRAPQLISLGQIESIVKFGNSSGADGGCNTNSLAS